MSELNTLAHRIAYDAARRDIEFYCVPVQIGVDSRLWFDLAQIVDPDQDEETERAVDRSGNMRIGIYWRQLAEAASSNPVKVSP